MTAVTLGTIITTLWVVVAVNLWWLRAGCLPFEFSAQNLFLRQCGAVRGTVV